LVSGSYGKTSTWLNAAAEHERKGDLQRALFDLRVAKTVSRKDGKINAAIERVKSKIAEQTKKHMRQGKQALREGKLNQARNHYLRVLSLDPKHEAALAAMRGIDKRDSKAKMETKVALSMQNYRRSAKTRKQAKGFQEEAYTYSQQALLQPDEKPTDIGSYIQEIEAHLKKFPQDKEVRELLANTYFKQAQIAFEAERYGDALEYLNNAERASGGETKRLKKVKKQRKSYGKALYLKGVRIARDEPQHAIKYWEYALQFDPDDRKSRLRLRNIKSM
jgi:tetratricopeptide (TPR) repeat protein